jgi:hypothetical protein
MLLDSPAHAVWIPCGRTNGKVVAMGECRCEVLNVMSGAVATDYLRVHLDRVRTNGRGRVLYRCPDTGIGWTEDRRAEGHGDEVVVLRRDPS